MIMTLLTIDTMRDSNETTEILGIWQYRRFLEPRLYCKEKDTPLHVCLRYPHCESNDYE